MTSTRGHLLAELMFWKSVSRANAITALAKDAEHYRRAEARCAAARTLALKTSLLKAAAVARTEIVPHLNTVKSIAGMVERIEKIVGEAGYNADAAYQAAETDGLMAHTDQVVAQKSEQEWIPIGHDVIDGTRVALLKHVVRPHTMAVDSDGDFLIKDETGEIIAAGNIEADDD